MMKGIAVFSCAAFFALFFAACSQLDVQVATTDQAVVEGYLFADHLVVVKVTKEGVYGKDSINIPIQGLHIRVSDGLNEEILTELDSGNYTSKAMVARAGKSYSLKFDYMGRTVASSTVIPYKPQDFTQSAVTLTVPTMGGGPSSSSSSTIPDPIELNWTSDLTDYYMVVAQNAESNASLINSDANAPKRVFRNEPTQSNSNLLDFKNFSYLGKHYIILMRLNAEYAALYKASNTSSQNLTAPISNVTNGLGIFTGINSDTLFLYVYKSKK